MIKKLSTLLFIAVLLSAHNVDAQIPSLKDVFKKDFLIGTAMNTWQIEGKDTAADRLIKQQFNAVTPENCMKAEMIQPGWNTYNFDLADKLVAFAKKNNIKVNATILSGIANCLHLCIICKAQIRCGNIL
ncbi:MAG TPA: endo-1,4-beta-xylanase [Hanamia sp.]|nr:endo-1,4-beta-xylanase [Hanamia sp.]